MNITFQKVLLPRFKERQIKLGNRRCFHIRANGKDEYENYQVFQHKHIVYDNNVDIKEVDEHLEVVKKLNKEDKDDYFMSNGLDYDRCYEYINVVKYLNRCLTTASKIIKNDNSKSWKIKVPGWSIIGILAFMYYFVKDDT